MARKPTKGRSRAPARPKGRKGARAHVGASQALTAPPGQHANAERSIRTPEAAAEICRRIAEGASLRSICATEGMPGRTAVLTWLADDAAFAGQYARAREAQREFLHEDLVELADSALGKPAADVQAIRLAVDTRKWAASKLWPRKYGERGEQSMPIALNLPADMTTAAGIAAAADAILRAVSAGNMTPGEGAALAGILETRRRAIETEDIARRLAALEAAKGSA